MELFGVIVLIAAYVSVTLALPPCVCTRNMKPVCGSDGQTYNNDCLLKCAQANNPELILLREGTCAIGDVENCVVCPLNYAPVCGSNGKTYPNECALRCDSYSPNVIIKYQGECKIDEVKVVELPTCACTRETKFVCGTDGATYSNLCLLNCATKLKSELRLEYTGPCDDSVRVVEQPKPNPVCNCTRNLTPVCGSDGVTYNNECLLQCSGQGLSVAKYEPCDA